MGRGWPPDWLVGWAASCRRVSRAALAAGRKDGLDAQDLPVRPEPPGRGEDDADEADHEVLTVVVHVLARRVPRASLDRSPGTGARVGAHSGVRGALRAHPLCLGQGGPASSPPAASARAAKGTAGAASVPFAFMSVAKGFVTCGRGRPEYGRGRPGALRLRVGRAGVRGVRPEPPRVRPEPPRCPSPSCRPRRGSVCAAGAAKGTVGAAQVPFAIMSVAKGFIVCGRSRQGPCSSM